MKPFLLITITAISLLFSRPVFAQTDSSMVKSSLKADTTKHVLSMDAMYDRPFLKVGKLPVSFGGYIESDYQYVGTSGVTLGHQFEFRRFNLFAASTIAPHIKFLAEIEYENDPVGGNPAEATTGPQFTVPYAAVDFEFDPLLNLRGGIIYNPIGSFNENHDGPKYEFTDRPVAMSQLLPDTWSNAGFEFYGKHHFNHWVLGYEFALTGGFDGSIIDNAEEKTFLPASKENVNRFSSSASGEPLYTAKISIGNDEIGQFGFSYMGGVYDPLSDEGITIDTKRSVNIYDADFNATIPKTHTKITTEWALIYVTIPPDYTPEYSHRQYGGFIDIVQPIMTGKVLNWNHATISVALRAEYVAWNAETFAATGLREYNDLKSIMPAISFRPVPQAVIRLNYRIQNSDDITGNTIGAPLGATRGFSFGISTYF